MWSAMMWTMKTCSKCGEARKLAEFPFKSKAKGTRSSQCKPCRAAYVRERRGASTTRKKCSQCGAAKFMSDFPWKCRVGGRRAAACKACQRWASKAHHEKLTDEQRARYREAAKLSRAVRMKENQRRLAAYLRLNPCTDCGETKLVLLECDHVRGKKDKNIADMMRSGYSWNRISTELEKCDVRCVRCHRLKTAKDFGWWGVEV